MTRYFIHSRKHSLIIVLVAIMAWSWNSCETELAFTKSSGQLVFSADTLYLDTLFGNISSKTYSLKIYNPTKTHLSIPTVKLKSGSNSPFRFAIDGQVGNVLHDVEIMSKDSLFVFVEATIPSSSIQNQVEMLISDQLIFEQEGQNQAIELVSLAKDAIFLYPKRFDNGTTEVLEVGVNDQGESLFIQGFYLDDSELIFSAEKPYVIYGYAAIPSGKTAVFEAGSRVHFHAESGLIAADQSSLKVNGAISQDPLLLEKEVIFEGDRLEPDYEHVPGQWGMVWLTDGSTAHELNHLTIKNATIGLLMDHQDGSNSPTLTLKNVQIHNSALFNLWGKTAHIEAENSVFGSAGLTSFYGNIGGKYQFKHCTFSNDWKRSYRNQPTVLIDDGIELEDGSIFSKPLEKADFLNCVITGNQSIEFIANKISDLNFEFYLNHTAVKFQDVTGKFSGNPFYDFENVQHYKNPFINVTADFMNPDKIDYRLGEQSELIGKGAIDIANQVPFDISGENRTTNPDLGAYQHKF